MTSTTYTEARNNFKHYCDIACQDCDPVMITRERGENVVLISEEEWESIQETLFIAGSPNMMERLRASDEDEAAGRVHDFDSIEDLMAKAISDVSA